MHRKSKSLLVAAGLLVAVSPALARPARPLRPARPSPVKAYFGQVVVRPLEQGAVVALDQEDDGKVDRLFVVETSDSLASLALRADSAQVLAWPGHLVVIAPGQGRAIHFSVPGVPERALPAPGEGRPGPAPDGAGLDSRLRAAYDLTAVDTASSIFSRAGRLAPLSLGEVEAGAGLERDLAPLGLAALAPQSPAPAGVGDGGCAASCSIVCRDGSTCDITCGPDRCASCTCPLACTCS